MGYFNCEECDKCKIWDGCRTTCLEECMKPLNALDEYKEYKRLEEQGLLLRLPCKVGDTVYLINHSICETRKTPLKCIVDEFTFDKDNRCYAVLNGAMNFYALRRFKAVDVNKFGLTMFLTKEEAEQALKQMGE